MRNNLRSIKLLTGYLGKSSAYILMTVLVWLMPCLSYACRHFTGQTVSYTYDDTRDHVKIKVLYQGGTVQTGTPVCDRAMGWVSTAHPSNPYEPKVKIDTYHVDDNAFGGGSIDDLIITGRCEEIGQNAFLSCHIKNLTIYPSDDYGLKIRSGAFSGMWSINKIKIMDPTPPSVPYGGAFNSSCFDFSKLIVPKGSLEDYKKDSFWRNFKNISEEDFPIEDISIFISPSAKVYVGDILPVLSNIYPEYKGKNITYTSSNTKVVDVIDGKFVAVGAGTATLYAKCDNLSDNVTVTVLTREVTGISLDKIMTTLAVGESTSLIATVRPSNATDKTIKWTTSNVSVATVSTDGTVIAHSKGTATITATCGNFSAKCTVNVISGRVENVILNKTEASIIIGGNLTLTATLHPDNVTDKTIIWTSSDPTIATVDSNGIVTAHSLGTAIITATCDNVSATCTVTVTPVMAENVILNKTEASIIIGGNLTLTATLH
ncbi:MAG: Ig-like domain-containing protein, partial [Muribaculaceae bacterium]|nr:Ig-like domain-containing protein [Muribaculaceae bacterium]